MKLLSLIDVINLTTAASWQQTTTYILGGITDEKDY